MAVGYRLDFIAQKIDATLQGSPDYMISGMNALEHASHHEISFLSNPAFVSFLENSKAGAVIVHKSLEHKFSGNTLVVDNPYLGYAKASFLFDTHNNQDVSVHPSAVIAKNVIIPKCACIGAHVVIESGVRLGKQVSIGAGTFIGKSSIIGDQTELHSNITIYHNVVLGANCIIHSGVIIGSDGFGNAYDKGRWYKIAQLGGVVIGNDVEIGCNTCIDRGSFGNTEIHDGVRLDNLIQIAHNVIIGTHTAIASMTGISGSTVIGKHCRIGGGSGFAGHLFITDNVEINGMSMITRSIRTSGAYSSGTGFMSTSKWRKNAVRFRQLDSITKRLKNLESQKQ